MGRVGLVRLATPWNATTRAGHALAAPVIPGRPSRRWLYALMRGRRATMWASSGPAKARGCQVRRTQQLGGAALLAYGVLALGVAILTGISVSQYGFEDGDDPTVGLQFLRAHGDVYVLSGIGLVLMAVALTVAALSLDESLGARSHVVARRAVTTCGLFGAAFLVIAGVFQISAPGPVLRIEEFGPADGRAAYLVVQMAGTQVTYAAGLLAVSGWVVGICVLAGRHGVLPKALAWLGVIPALRIAVGLLGPLLDDASSALWLTYIAVIVGVNLWFLLAGLWLLLRPVTPVPLGLTHAPT